MTTTPILPIDVYTFESRITTYRPFKGDSPVVFRSLLEARWAYALDALHLPWEYEPKQFRLPDGTVYTPDFYVEGVGYVEIKPGLPQLLNVKDKLHSFASFAKEVVPDGKIPKLYSFDAKAPALTNGCRGSVILWFGDGLQALTKPQARRLLCAPDSEDFRKAYPDWFADHVDRVLTHAGVVKIGSEITADDAVLIVREAMKENGKEDA